MELGGSGFDPSWVTMTACMWPETGETVSGHGFLCQEWDSVTYAEPSHSMLDTSIKQLGEFKTQHLPYWQECISYSLVFFSGVSVIDICRVCIQLYEKHGHDSIRNVGTVYSPHPTFETFESLRKRVSSETFQESWGTTYQPLPPQ